MTMTVDELLARARHYWPANLDWYFRGEETPETARRFALWEQQWRQHGKQWHALLTDLAKDLPGFSIRDATAPSDVCFRCAVRLPREGTTPLVQVVVGCLSMIAPVYSVYGLQYEVSPATGTKPSDPRLFLDALPPEMHEPANALAKRMEAVFGASPLLAGLAGTPVPLCVNITCPPRTTLFHALISDQPDSVP